MPFNCRQVSLLPSSAISNVAHAQSAYGAGSTLFHFPEKSMLLRVQEKTLHSSCRVLLRNCDNPKTLQINSGHPLLSFFFPVQFLRLNILEAPYEHQSGPFTRVRSGNGKHAQDLERVPEAKFSWKPHDKSGTMIWLASHLADIPSWASMTIQHDERICPWAVKRWNNHRRPRPPKKCWIASIST